ncbi:MOXD1 homolog 1-like isoform X2 [Procambarus clarkii]|uniref:MOXD1 homolog 1-like isoform X2 n=1 Tax=Procambarus clarkii TaxID=6728 RepID=UPI0037427023
MGSASCVVMVVMVMVMVMMVTGLKGVSMDAEATGSLPPLEYTRRSVLDQKGKYVVMWAPGDNQVIFEVQVATKGYVGLGFSPNGGMKGADMVLGWVDDSGKVFLQDRHSTGYAVPIIDESQDVELLGGYQNDTHTVLRFSRPWKTCDLQADLQLSDETVKLIWAIAANDPTDEMTMRKHSERGTKSLYLQSPELVFPTPGGDVKAWDLLSPNVSLPNDLRTLYWCSMNKIPPLTSKTQAIGFVPLIEEKNMQHVHHILVYECHVPDSARHFEKWLGMPGLQCYGPNMPVSWTYCSIPVFAWGIGGEGDLYPENVGLPLGEEYEGATYFLKEIHYDNPDLKQDIVDASGLRVLYTETLREHDAGVLTIGHDISPLLVVPPGTHWLTVGICHPDCTQQGLPEDGIKVFEVLLHSHILGSKMKIRQIRQNQELEPLVQDLNYDFSFQHQRPVNNISVLRGDALILECDYDSTSRDHTTFGGFGTEEEMCLAFLTYYPRVPLAVCLSTPHVKDILEGVGVDDTYHNDLQLSDIDEEVETVAAAALLSGEAPLRVKNLALSDVFFSLVAMAPEKYHNETLHKILNDRKTWDDNLLAATLQDKIINDLQVPLCVSREGILPGMPEIFLYPGFIPLDPPVEKCGDGTF